MTVRTAALGSRKIPARGPTAGAESVNFEGWVRLAQARLQGWLPGGGLGGRALAVLGLLGVLLWLLTGCYTIGPNEVGLNMIFGRYTGKTTSGLNYNLPYPIGSVQKLAVTDRNTTDIGFISRMDDRTGEQATFDLPEESLMLTDDQNIADVKFVVIWQIDPSHPEDYAFNVDDTRRHGEGRGGERDARGDRAQPDPKYPDRRSQGDRTGCSGFGPEDSRQIQNRRPHSSGAIAVGRSAAGR